MTEDGKVVGVRLTAELYRLLADAADKAGVTPTSFARKLVVEGLTLGLMPESKSIAGVGQMLAEMQSHIDRLDRELVSKRRAAPVVTQPTPAAGSSPAAASNLKEWVTRTRPAEREDGND